MCYIIHRCNRASDAKIFLAIPRQLSPAEASHTLSRFVALDARTLSADARLIGADARPRKLAQATDAAHLEANPSPGGPGHSARPRQRLGFILRIVALRKTRKAPSGYTKFHESFAGPLKRLYGHHGIVERPRMDRDTRADTKFHESFAGPLKRLYGHHGIVEQECKLELKLEFEGEGERSWSYELEWEGEGEFELEFERVGIGENRKRGAFVNFRVAWRRSGADARPRNYTNASHLP